VVAVLVNNDSVVRLLIFLFEVDGLAVLAKALLTLVQCLPTIASGRCFLRVRLSVQFRQVGTVSSLEGANTRT
jgi:hypothetical protein